MTQVKRPMREEAVPLVLDDTIAAVWPVAGDRRAPRRGQHPFYKWIRRVFVVFGGLAMLALLVVLGMAWAWPSMSGPAYMALINVNLVLGGMLGLYIFRRVVVMMLDRRGKLRGGSLHWRVLGIFAILAVLPAVGVSGVAIYLLNQGIESWFAVKVSSALEGGRAVAEGYLEESGRGFQSEMAGMSRDPLWQLPPMLLPREQVQVWLRGQLRDKQMDELQLVDSDGQVLASASGMVAGVPDGVRDFMQGPLPREELFRSPDGSHMVAVVPLGPKPGKGSYWLVGQKALNAGMLTKIAETAAAYNAYAQLREERGNLRVLVSMFLLMLLAATVSAAVWAGIRLANKIVHPVTELVHGTNRVSAGDLTVRLEPRDDDELGVLTQAFNRMTLQLATGRDLLERKNAELDTRRKFMEAVLTGVSAGVVAVDDGGVVRVANQSAHALLGLESGQKLAKVAPELSEVVRELGRSTQTYGQKMLAQKEVKVQGADGDNRTLMVRLVPQVGDGGKNGVVLTFDDITPLMGAQRVAAWRDVARRLAHEIKNPLTPIQLSAERLKRKYMEKLPQEDRALFKQLTETIVQQSEEMRRMTNEFSDFARMPQAVLQDEELIGILDDVVALQRARGGVLFTTEYEVDAAVVKMDKGQVQRVFTNLLENAHNAIAEREGTKLPQGEVRIVVRKTQPDMLAVDIHDNGRGLPEDVEVEHLFDPYVTTRKGGTGLGLAIVKKVMDEHNGTVRLLRRKGGGTTVALGFPLSQQEILTYEHEQPISEKQRARHSGGGRRGRN